MEYGEFISWCIDTSRKDRAAFVAELATNLNSLLEADTLSQRCAEARKRVTKSKSSGTLRKVINSARKGLT